MESTSLIPVGNHATFRSIYNMMQEREMNLVLHQQLPNSDIVIQFLCLAKEDCFLIQSFPGRKHLGSVHFHPDLGRANAYFGGDGMNLFEGLNLYDIDDPNDVQIFLRNLQRMLEAAVREGGE